VVAEQRGVIRVYEGIGDPTPVTLDDERTEVHNWSNRGLLGLAVDPGFPVDPYLYVLYSRDATIGGQAPLWGTAGADEDGCVTPPRLSSDPNPASCPASGRLQRLQLAPDAGSVVDRATLVDDWCVQFETHSVGALGFGASGALYASAGEGADYYRADYGQVGTPANACGDPASQGGALRAQDLRSAADPAGLGGAVVRLDPATGAAAAGNPAAADPDANVRRVVAEGLRNPFRFAIRPGTDELWIGDVGWSTTEEINRLTPGAVRNFGWPCYEGAARQPTYDALDLSLCEGLYSAPGAETAPFLAYDHTAAVTPGDGCVGASDSSAVSGLAFEQGSAFPAAYDGALFFADISRGCIWAIADSNDDAIPEPGQVSRFVGDAVYPVDLQFGPDGSLYYVDLFGGTVRRVCYGSCPVARVSASPAAGRAPLAVELDASASTDPGDPASALSYRWDLDGDGSYDDGSGARLTHTYREAGVEVAALRVTDPGGRASLAATTIEVSPAPDGPDGPAPRCEGRAATISGGAGGERLRGTAGPDVIVGGAGRDRIRGAGGGDRICAGNGDDEVRGGGGRDRIDGGPGDDELRGGGGRDRIDGGPGDDVCGRGHDRRSRCESG